MRLKSFAILTVLLISTIAEPVSAQSPSATPPCELHVWPAERVGSMTVGMLGVLGVLPAVADIMLHSGRDASNKAQIASALDSQTQLDALDTLDLPFLLELAPGTIVVRHEQPLQSDSLYKVKSRRSDSRAACYIELITTKFSFKKTPVYGRSLNTGFMIRDFGSDQKIDFEYRASGGSGLPGFPPKPGDDFTSVADQLVVVFKQNFEEYANSARKTMRARRAI